MLFLVVTLVPLAVLTQAPFAKSITSKTEAEPENGLPEHEAWIDTVTFSHGEPPSDPFAFSAVPPFDFASPFRPSTERVPASLLAITDSVSTDPFLDAATPPEFEPERNAYADRLAQQLVELIAPNETASPAPPMVRFIPPDPPPAPALPPLLRSTDEIPLYDVWLSFLQDQPRPKRADEFLPRLKRIFAEEGVPEELAWLPEIESMFNPRARNRIGARGLFQFMPGTALEQGLRLRPHDERVHPEKSARAAAALLRRLHESFDSWPLALAAYNAGEYRVRRALETRDATTFAEIAHALPSETRLYVPRVLATLAIRKGHEPALLAAID